MKLEEKINQFKTSLESDGWVEFLDQPHISLTMIHPNHSENRVAVTLTFRPGIIKMRLLWRDDTDRLRCQSKVIPAILAEDFIGDCLSLTLYQMMLERE